MTQSLKSFRVGAFFTVMFAAFLVSVGVRADLGPQGADLNFDSYPDKSVKVPGTSATARKIRVKKAKTKTGEQTLTPEDAPAASVPATLPSSAAADEGSIRSPMDTAAPTHIGIPELEVGLSLQPYQPGGLISLSGLQPYDVSIAGNRPMAALDFDWMPWQFDLDQPLALGLFGSMGYARSSISLTGADGSGVSGTELQTLKAQLGAVLAWQPDLASIYRLRLQIGGGQWNQIQTSDATYANHSAFEYFGSLGVYGDIHFMPRSAPALAAYVGYDYRTPLTAEPEEIVLQRNNFIAGLAGTFQ